MGFSYLLTTLVPSGPKTHPNGSWTMSVAVWHYSHKTWAACTTLFMAVNWANEAKATRLMRSAPALLSAYGTAITIIFCITMIFDIIIMQGTYFYHGFFLPYLNGIGITVIVTLVAVGCGFFFISQAQAVTSHLAAASAT